jgi:DNA-binding CsgD family transcriptional regulator
VTTTTHELKAIESKLDTLIRLLALRVAEDKKSVKEKALVLRLAGIGPSEIAKLCGTTPNTINVALSQAKMNRKKSGKAKATKSGKRK